MLRLLKLLDKLVIRIATWEPKDHKSFEKAAVKIRKSGWPSKPTNLIDLLELAYTLVPIKDGWAITKEICGEGNPMEWLLKPEKLEPARRKLLVALAAKIPD